MEDQFGSVPTRHNIEEENSSSFLVSILILIVLIIVGGLIGSGITLGLATTKGIDFQTFISSLNENSPLADRNFARWANLFSHLFTFVFPAIVLALIFYKKRWLEYLKLDRFPNQLLSTLGIVLLFASFVVAQFSLWINQQIPLPDWATELEESTEQMIKGIMVMDSPLELIFNLFIIAVLPALGEEFVFRGILQQKLEKWWKNGHLAIFVTALLFSAMHMQFAGFLPRFILGLLLGYVFYWSRSLWLPILLHFLFNGMQVLAYYFYGSELDGMDVEKGDTVNIPLSIAAIIIVGILAYYMQLNRVRDKTEVSV